MAENTSIHRSLSNELGYDSEDGLDDDDVTDHGDRSVNTTGPSLDDSDSDSQHSELLDQESQTLRDEQDFTHQYEPNADSIEVSGQAETPRPHQTRQRRRSFSRFTLLEEQPTSQNFRYEPHNAGQASIQALRMELKHQKGYFDQQVWFKLSEFDSTGAASFIFSALLIILSFMSGLKLMIKHSKQNCLMSRCSNQECLLNRSSSQLCQHSAKNYRTTDAPLQAIFKSGVPELPGRISTAPNDPIFKPGVPTAPKSVMEMQPNITAKPTFITTLLEDKNTGRRLTASAAAILKDNNTGFSFTTSVAAILKGNNTDLSFTISAAAILKDTTADFSFTISVAAILKDTTADFSFTISAAAIMKGNNSDFSFTTSVAPILKGNNTDFSFTISIAAILKDTTTDFSFTTSVPTHVEATEMRSIRELMVYECISCTIQRKSKICLCTAMRTVRIVLNDFELRFGIAFSILFASE
ncbi:hypothetical protein AC579_2651 [Pseudocercospora musae]|uniref:Uncharacterized protein n=1 Tax=Pseudocercospora musae TaxID=113226 RepID=A0A139GT80_9PEZI|nr:hypothetical protein AC579_2651 [Pseudocercospora musae]